jgi:uracil-DNA glycosylase
MFTGDKSGDWLYRALYKAGFANQPASISRKDGMQLLNCYITACCRCAPPQNKLLREEILQCRPFLLEELVLLKNIRIVIGLGRIGFEAVINSFMELGQTDISRKPKFGHGLIYRLNSTATVIASFHPSQQNTFTKRLTEEMFDGIFIQAKRILKEQ